MSGNELRERILGVLVLMTRVAVWGYLAVVLGFLFVARFKIDDWWLGTVMAFGPIWLGLGPLVVLLPIVLMLRARLVGVLVVATGLFLFGVMGFCVPSPWREVEDHGYKPIVCVTSNVEGHVGDWQAVTRLIEREKADVVGLQEFAGGQLEFPDGWRSVRGGSLLIASPFPIVRTRQWVREEPPRRGRPIALYGVIEMPGQTLHVCCVHLTALHDGLEAVLDQDTVISPSRSQKLKEQIELRRHVSEELAQWIRELPQVDLIMGDFNMPVESSIYRKSWSGYQNAFSVAGFGVGYTRWTVERNVSFGVRIDHVLVGDQWDTLSCHVGPDVGSDHLPVLAEIVSRKTD